MCWMHYSCSKVWICPVLERNKEKIRQSEEKSFDQPDDVLCNSYFDHIYFFPENRGVVLV